MSVSIKILLVGLIVAVAAFFGLKHLKSSRPQTIRVAITQIAPHPSLDQIRQGIIDELTAALGDRVEFIYQNAQGNMATASQIAKNYISLKPDLIVPITTPSAQTVKNAAKGHSIPIVFAAVTNPEEAKLFDENSTVQGVSDQLDPKFQVNLLKDIYGERFKTLRVGTIYNAGEANAVHQVEIFEEALKDAGLPLIKVSLQNTSEIAQSVRALSDKVDVIYIMNDNAVVSGITQLLNIAKEHKIAVFTSDPHSVEHGAMASIAYDQYDIGRLAGTMSLNILQGKATEKLLKPTAPAVYLNYETASALGIEFPDALKAKEKRLNS